MITITTEPDSIALGAAIDVPKPPPVPMSDCVRWCLQPDVADAVATPGSRATVTVSFPVTATVPANGTAFKIWGYDFEVQSAQDFTSESFKVTTVGLQSAVNFVNMMEANIFFRRAASVALAFSTTWDVTLTWNDCREQPRFSSEQMDLAVFTAIGGTGAYLNGVSPEYVPGFRVVTRALLFDNDAGAFAELSTLEGLEVDKLCDAVGEVCVNYRDDIQTQLWTDLPELSSTSIISSDVLGSSLLRLFSLEYGWTYQENCVAKSGTFKKSDLVPALNAVFRDEDPYKIRRYWANHPDGFPPDVDRVEFLTTQPKGYTICDDSFLWLWFLNNWQETNGEYRLFARFGLFDGATTEQFDFFINDPDTDASAWNFPVCFNVSPAFVYANAPTFTPAQIKYYTVRVYGINAEDEIFAATETLKYVPVACCGESTDLYFLTSPGGIGTMSVNIDEREIVQEGTEVNLFVPCDTSAENRARYGGRTLVNLRNYERVSFSAKSPKKDENWQDWFLDMKKSPQCWLRVDDGFGGFVAKKLIIDPGSIKIHKTGELAEMKAAGYLADFPTQSPSRR